MFKTRCSVCEQPIRSRNRPVSGLCPACRQVARVEAGKPDRTSCLDCGTDVVQAPVGAVSQRCPECKAARRRRQVRAAQRRMFEGDAETGETA